MPQLVLLENVSALIMLAEDTLGLCHCFNDQRNETQGTSLKLR